MNTPPAFTLPHATRRGFIAASTLAFARSLLAVDGAAPSRFGLCTFSCHQHWKALRAGFTGVKFTDPVGFYRYACDLGAEGVQTPLHDTEPALIRQLIEKAGHYYEGEVQLPRKESDLAGFEHSVRRTREAGATVARAVFTSGRRYEVFKTMEDFRAFHDQAGLTLGLIEPILKKHQLRVAIENHKDHTTEELVKLISGVSSEWIGVLVDTGNNLALLEEPHQVCEALAPFALSVHLKDMAIQPGADGFLLSEVPLGTGMLDLPRIIATLRKANPAIVFNLEMATRDPLRIPCLTDGYFVTMPGRKETHLESAMQLVKANPPRGVIPSVSGKPFSQIIAEEEINNRESLQWMKKHFS